MLGPHVPRFELPIDDLCAVPKVALLEREMPALGRVVVWVLRAVRVGYDHDRLGRWVEELNAAERAAPRESFEHVLQYLLGNGEGAAPYAALADLRLS